MAAYGVPRVDIAKTLDINHVTLEKYFHDELEKSAIEANTKVADTLFKMATSGENISATIFWLKCRARWREVHPPENEGDSDTGPVRHYVLVPEKITSIDEWATKARTVLETKGNA